MVGDAPAPQPIRMTAPAEPAIPKGEAQPYMRARTTTSSPKTPNGVYVGWTVVSVVVFMIVSSWSFAWWMSPPIYFGMLFLFLTFVMVFRMNGLQKANPRALKEDLIKNCFGSLLMVLGGYAIAVILIIVYVFTVLLS